MNYVQMNALALAGVELSTTLYSGRFERIGYAEAKAGSRLLLVSVACAASERTSLFDRTCKAYIGAALLLGGYITSLLAGQNQVDFLDGVYEGLIEGAIYTGIGSRTIDRILIETVR